MNVDFLSRDSGPLVPWGSLGQARFDTLIEALIAERHPSEAVEPVDGRGGDEGVDVRVVTATGKLHIYQLKYFPEGFAGRFKDRQSQIRSSLKSALKHHPDRWILVAPCEPTPQAYGFLAKLRKDHPDVTIDFVDRAQLNGSGWVAGHQSVVRALITRDEILAKAAILQQEKAVMAAPARDLASRIVGLAEVADDVDPNYRVDFARRGDHVIQTIIPRHETAAQNSPIRFGFGLSAEAAAQDTRAGLDRALRFGSLAPVVVPGEHIKDFTVSGTAWMETKDDFLPSQIELHAGAIDVLGVSIALVLTAQDGTVTHHQGKVVRSSNGTEGFTFAADFYDFVRLTWVMPFVADSGAGDFSVGSSDDPSTTVAANRDGMRLVGQLHRARTMELHLNGDRILTGTISSGRAMSESSDADILGDIADDLAVIQDATHSFFPFPDSITQRDRELFRAVRIALEGEPTWYPRPMVEFTVTSKAGLLEDPALRDAVEGVPQSMYWQGLQVMEVSGKEVKLPDISLFLPQIRVLNGPEFREAIDAGATEAKLKITTDGKPWATMWCPSRLKDPQARLEARPWDLRGEVEPVRNE